MACKYWTTSGRASNQWANKADWQKDYNFPGYESGIFPSIRDEVNVFLYGNTFEPPRGFWIIHRKMDMSQTSPDWDPENQEAYRGYRWLYTDHLIRVRYMTYPQDGNEDGSTIGYLENPAHIFFAKWDADIKKEDLLIEIKPQDTLQKPLPNTITLRREYDILRADEVKGDLGRVEYLRIYAKDHSPRGNQRLPILNLVD